MKQQFSDSEQQAVKDRDGRKKENKGDKLYQCPSLLPGGNFQTAVRRQLKPNPIDNYMKYKWSNYQLKDKDCQAGFKTARELYAIYKKPTLSIYKVTDR